MVTVRIQPDMWAKWANIAVRAEGRSWQARNQGLARTGEGSYLAFENEEAITTVTAVRHTFHHLWLEWKDLVPVDDEPDLPPVATTDHPNGTPAYEAWLNGLAAVVIDRGRVVHHREMSEPPAPHPSGKNVSQQAAHFTAERATDAVDRMLDFLERVLSAPGPGLTDWAAKRQHVLQGFLDLRADPFLPD